MEIYDDQNVTIRLPQYHNFRFQIFVSPDHPEGWAYAEKIIELMDIDDEQSAE